VPAVSKLGQPADTPLWIQRAGGEWAGLMLGPFLLAAVLIAVIWYLALTRIGHEERLEVRDAFNDNRHISALVEANLSEVLGKTALYADLSLALLSGEQNIAAHLSPLMTGDRAYLKIVLFDAAGKLRYSSARRQSEAELEETVQSTTQGLRNIPPQGQVAVGRPLTKTGTWSVPIIAGLWRGGRSSGVLVAVLDLGYFLQLFQKADLQPGSRIELLNADGYQLVESNGGTISAGRDYTGSDYLRFLRSGKSGAEVILRTGDPSPSVSAFRRLDDYPLIVVVSQESESVLAGFRLRRDAYLGWASSASFLLAVSAGLLGWLADRRRRTHHTLVLSEAENRKLIAQLEDEKTRTYKLASQDHLTGLPNRLLFTELARSHILRARRSRKRHAVMFIDLDRFKMINDTLGHHIGDLLLIEVARRFRACVRESDVVARFGGDEFVLLINDADSVDSFKDMASKIIAAIKEPFALDGHSMETTPSIGIAIYPTDGDEIDLLLRHADEAMYAAKAAGRGTYRFHDIERNQHALRSAELLQGLQRAVREDQFVVHYQPRVAVRNFEVLGLEALVRWQHPEHGLIYPNEFITQAEEHDLIDLLGAWVIDTVCKQIADWQSRGVPLVPVAINVSAKQFRHEDLATKVTDARNRHNVPADMLELEITESCLIDRPEHVVRILTNLVAQGIKVSLDDYGTGFASLSYLKTMPVYAVKIDRSFIREILNDSNDATIVASITTLAHNLRLVVVAEGVETKSQLVHLKTIGCDQVQGYYFQRPVAASEIEAVLFQGTFFQ
jgi:diguanylate cyclase (GGDEF)-like protein